MSDFRSPSNSAVIVCFNRCMICGRRTPHEVCHRPSTPLGGDKNWPSCGPSGMDFSRNQRRMWMRGFGKPAEVCEDPACPQLLHDWSSNPAANGCTCNACKEAV